LAEAVARRLGLSPAGPRDAVAAAAALGIAVEKAALPSGVRAVWCRSGRRFRILVSRRLKPAAANFAVAHELYEIVAPARPNREAAADRFAAAFLLPPKWALAAAANVPPAVARQRLRDRGQETGDRG
jgi:hypothetical protein